MKYCFSFKEKPNDKKNRIFILGLILTALFSMNSANAQSVTNGTHNYTGASAIQLAINDINFGPNLNVSSGLYSKIIVNRSVNIFSKNPYPTKPIIDVNDDAILITNINFINITGLRIKTNGSNHENGFVLSNASYCNISENIIFGNLSEGIVLEQSNNNIFIKNSIDTTGQGVAGVKIESCLNNSFYYNTINSDEGIRLSNLSGPCMYNTFIGNNIRTSSIAVILQSSSYNFFNENNISSYAGLFIHSLYLTSSSKNNIFTQNYIYSSTAYGLGIFPGCSNNVFTNCTISGREADVHIDCDGDNSLLNSTCSKIIFEADALGKLFVYWNWEIYVRDKKGSPIANVIVIISNPNTNYQLFSGYTDANGYIRFEVTYIDRSHSYSTYRITVEKSQ